jgi:hypothetical protein
MSLVVTEEYLADRMLVNVAFRPENNFVFRDDRLDTSICPMYSSTRVTISFKYRAKDKTEAIRWRDDIRNRTSMNREHFLHDITYHYLVPLEQIVILKEIHRMREAGAPDGEE